VVTAAGAGKRLSIRPPPASLKEALIFASGRQAAGLVEREVASCRPYCLMRVLTNGSRRVMIGNILGGGPAPQERMTVMPVDLGSARSRTIDRSALLSSVERLSPSFAVTTRYPAKDSMLRVHLREHVVVDDQEWAAAAARIDHASL